MLEMDMFIGMDDKYQESLSQKGTPDSRKNIQVLPNVGAAHTGEDILWRVHSLDHRVKEVKISFNQHERFFLSNRTSNEDHECPITLRRDTDTQNGYGTIVGRVPPGTQRGVNKNEYTIFAIGAGWDGPKTELYKLDPIIVTVDP